MVARFIHVLPGSLHFLTHYLRERFAGVFRLTHLNGIGDAAIQALVQGAGEICGAFGIQSQLRLYLDFRDRLTCKAAAIDRDTPMDSDEPDYARTGRKDFRSHIL
jgi:hypothetical protein